MHFTTVSLVFHDNPRIPAATAARVRAMASAMGYDPARNSAARRLIGLKYGHCELNHLIALGFPFDFHRFPFWTRIFYGILDTLAPECFGVVTAPFFSQYAITVDDLLPVIRRGEVDGIITQAGFVPFLQSCAAIAELPIVAIVDASDQAPTVQIDEPAGAYLAMRHLLDLGHRAVLHFVYHPGDESQSGPNSRLCGVRQALAEDGLSAERCLYTIVKPERWILPLESSGECAFAEMPPEELDIRRLLAATLRAHPEVTAIQTINDADAIRVFYHLKALGIRVPEDISLIGCDDVDPLLDADRNNILTTITMPLREIGQQAARMMLARLRGEVADHAMVTLQPTLTIRKTTARPGSPA